MSRWNNKSYVVPFESLITKEKENTNRPVPARSAGTVGKWGKMGFTSTRTYTIKAMQTAVMSPEQSPQSGECANLGSPTEAPKPKKFFKSRNASLSDIMMPQQVITHLPRAPPSPVRSEASPPKKEPNIKIKIAKGPRERKKSLSEKKIHTKKKKKEEKIIKPEAPPSRRIARTRKVVNYNEEEDDSRHTPIRELVLPKSIHPIENNVMEPPPAVAKLSPAEHPPIVLRISKGTSRLISTDSEDVLNSPVHEPIMPEQPLVSTDELTDALSTVQNDEEFTQLTTRETPMLPETEIASNFDVIHRELSNVQNENPEIVSKKVSTEATETAHIRQEGLKLIIKADVLKPVKRPKTRKHKNAAANLKVLEHQFKTPSPQPGSENCELYRTLTASPSDKDFDSQSSILGSISSKETSAQFQVAAPDESCVVRSRGSSDITSDLETSQHSSLVAPPSDIEARLESMMDCDDDELPSLPTASGSESKIETAEDILLVLSGSVPEKLELREARIVVTPVPETRAPPELETKDPPELETKDPSEPERSAPPENESTPASLIVAEPETHINEVEVPVKRVTRGRRGVQQKSDIVPEKAPTKNMRVTRNNNNNNNNGTLKKVAPLKSYTRKRKAAQSFDDTAETLSTIANNAQDSDLVMQVIDNKDETPCDTENQLPSVDTVEPVVDEIDRKEDDTEYKVKNKFKNTCYERDTKVSHEDAYNEMELVQKEQQQIPSTRSLRQQINKHSTLISTENNLNRGNTLKASKILNNNNDDCDANSHDDDDEKRSVKLVISKKKGSIFKSRALVAEQGDSKKRHVYKHTWDADDVLTENDKKAVTTDNKKIPSNIEAMYNDFGEIENVSTKLTRITRQNTAKFDDDNVTTVKCDKKAKEYYTVVRNVKAAHQIQEIGEYQEMDDDIEYILDALQPHNPTSTRCLSAIQLASKCMTPAFRMHVRAHGTVTKFYKALKDATKDLSLGLCTATIMFVLSQDTLNIDLDRDSLELMMNLLETDQSRQDEYGMTNFERNKSKVKEICEEIKSQGKATHLNLDTVSIGTLAMETLLSLTSKRAGEWFKEELRELGGLEHIIKTICDCCHQISDYVVNWTEVLLDKLKTIERCLRVLENVSQQNERNQEYILTYSHGHAIKTLVKLYKLCDSEIALYPTTDSTPKGNPGVILREALVPTLKVLINLTHPFDQHAKGSVVLGASDGIFDTSFHILLQAPSYIPERCIFELSILVLLLLINLTTHTIPNRRLIMQSHAPTDFGNQFDKVPAIKALIEYFYRCEEQARVAEQNTDAILANPDKNNKITSQEEVDETLTKLLQKAGHHMEHTFQASYAGILIGHLISESEENEQIIREYLRDKSFKSIVTTLEKYHNFMNLTASSEATNVSHMKSTKTIIDYFKKCDLHSTTSIEKDADDNQSSTSFTAGEEDQMRNSSPTLSPRKPQRVYKTYSQR